MKLRRAISLLDRLGTQHYWTSEVFPSRMANHISSRTALNDDMYNPVNMKDIHMRPWLLGSAKWCLHGTGKSGSRSLSVSWSLLRMPAICLAFTMKCLSLLGKKEHCLRKWFALEWPACLHKRQTLSWWVCLVQSSESLLLPRWGWWKSSATVACRILAFVWSADFLKKRIKLWDFWRGCDIPSLFYIAVWPIEEDWTMKFSRVGDISSSSGTCSPRHIKPLACSKGPSTKAVRCWYRSLAGDLESKLLWTSLTDELEKGWVLHQGTAWNNGAVIGNLI